MTNITTIIKSEINAWKNIQSLNIHSANDINNGYCKQFANGVKETMGNPEDLIIHTYGMHTNEHIPYNHAWIEYNGRHYDAERPEGVDEAKQLPIFHNEINPIEGPN
jgi:hypothetical protein